jgi:hypothetical protein
LKENLFSILTFYLFIVNLLKSGKPPKSRIAYRDSTSADSELGKLEKGKIK